MIDLAGLGQWLTHTDEARIHLQARAGNNLDRVALAGGVRFPSELGACEMLYAFKIFI
jgi:hypothetical protein